MKLREIAKVIRSKNAGPYILTFDILFSDREVFDRVKRSGQLTAAAVAQLYRVSPNEIIGFEYHSFANAVKFSMRRPAVSGSIGDTDVYGAQQYAPLLELEINSVSG